VSDLDHLRASLGILQNAFFLLFYLAIMTAFDNDPWLTHRQRLYMDRMIVGFTFVYMFVNCAMLISMGRR
jgi:hypothetical protein